MWRRDFAATNKSPVSSRTADRFRHIGDVFGTFPSRPRTGFRSRHVPCRNLEAWSLPRATYKSAMSETTQVEMEAFVPWVIQQLDDLLGIPREDERRGAEMNVRAEMDLLIRHQLNRLLKLQKTVKVDIEPHIAVLDPWIRHMLLSAQQEHDIVCGVKAELNDLLEQQLALELKGGWEKIAVLVKPRLLPILDPLIQQRLEILLGQLKQDEWRKMVLDVKAVLEPILKMVLQNTDDRKKALEWENVVDEDIDVSYEAVDLLQEHRNLCNTPGGLLKKVRRSSLSRWLTLTPGSGVRVIDESTSKIKAINNKLALLREKTRENGQLYSRSYKNPNYDIYLSLMNSPETDKYFSCCRRLEKKSVLEQLLHRETNAVKDVKVISIVGRGGSGKTTLAHFVYNDPGAQQLFELKAWVSVTNSFDEKRIARDFLLSMVKDEHKVFYEKRIRRSIEKDGEKASESMFKLIEEYIRGKVFLCVFDDVWTEYESSKCKRFTSLLRFGAPGSRILVTTRSERVARIVGSEPDWTHNLEALTNEEWWELWRDHLALNEQNKISRKMKELGSKIAEKCHGWSLLAVALGDILLKKNTAEEWEHELNKVSEMGDEMWKMEGVAQKLFRHFYLSYYKLSPALRLCILYCAGFDKGTVIIVDQLIRMWMAQGYLGDPYDETDCAKTLKGLEYFDVLASQSFFQEFTRVSIHKNMITSCKLNDTFHDFVRYVTGAALGQEKHFSVQEKRRERYFHIKLDGQVPQDLSSGRWKGVKAFVLSSSQLDQVPQGVGSLNCVRYLDLSNNPLKELPEAICNLGCLEHLDVHQCYLLLCLPQQIGKLNQLKHLRVDHTTEELHRNLPKGFEKLTLIQTLDVFRAGGSYEDAIKKLNKMIHLVDICITVHGEVNFSDAGMDIKQHLENLEICFVGEGRDQEKARKSMEDLKPPRNLKMLKFENYPLKALPSWILEQSLIKSLTRLSLKSAWNITSFPALWKLSSLEFLWLYDIPNLKHIGREFFGLPDKPKLPEMQNHEEKAEEVVIDYIEEDVEITVQGPCDFPGAKKATSFPRLKTLRIEYMKNLVEWEDLEEGEKEVNDIDVMPLLEELIIKSCPKQPRLPLCILGNTPWYKTNHPPHPEAAKLVLPTIIGTSTEKDCYKRLKKFVRNAYCDYITEGFRDHFEESIPKGVLGSTEVTSCLSLKDLCLWFEPDGRVFAEQLCIWSKLVYELMTQGDKERVQMVSSTLITTVGRKEDQPDTRAEDLVNFMTSNKARLYLVPYLKPAHWELLAIVPEIGVTYRFDSLHRDIEIELTDFLKEVETIYVIKSPNSNELLGSNWRIADIKHKRQTGNWECGYYIMIWMYKIAVNIQSLDLEPHFPVDESPYEPDDLERLAQKWCAYVLGLPQFSGV